MNCRDAERLISAEREGALDDAAMRALENHLRACPACKQSRALLTDAANAWRDVTEAAVVPNVGREWQHVRRRRRTAEGNAVPGRLKWAGGLAGAAAVLAVVFFSVRPGGFVQVDLVARAESVEVADPAATPVVFVDEDSGWLVVWSMAGGSGPKS